MLTGHSLIGASDVQGESGFRAIDPATNQKLDPPFNEAGCREVEQACSLAAAAFDAYRESPLAERAKLLRTIAEEIDALGGRLIERVMGETGLPEPRVRGELGRTVGQLQMFGDLVVSGRWLDMRIDAQLPTRNPPRPELRQRRIPLGAVAVFGASNFPLAFSVAGGDTASALAAGCPVVAKGHPAHPGTSELIGRALRTAVRRCKMPEGVFSLLQGSSLELGAALVAEPRIKAVGFTGSRRGGLALMAIANARPEPIPVYAEMSSINPVILLPSALAARSEALGQAYAASVTLGAGQFCTNPGVVLAIEGPALERFVAAASLAMTSTNSAPMLSPGIHQAFEHAVRMLSGRHDVVVAARGAPTQEVNRCRGVLIKVDALAYSADRELSSEIFGAASLIVHCRDIAQIRGILEDMEGQLTATMHCDAEDFAAARTLLPILERKVGRIIANGWPTGVEVSSAMVHGGPFPATSDGRSTSVGTAAIERFLRPICYQNLPIPLLPPLMLSS